MHKNHVALLILTTLTMLGAVACFGASDNHGVRPDQVEPSPSVLGTTPSSAHTTTIDLNAVLEADKDHLEFAGCPYISTDRAAFACWHVLLDMGFGAVSLDFYDTNKPGAPERVNLIGRDDGEDDWMLRDTKIRTTQARLVKGGFVAVKWKKGKAFQRPAQRKLTLINGAPNADVPVLSKDRAKKCCKWTLTPHTSTDVRGVTLIAAKGDCDWIDAPGKTCHVEGYNDESYTSTERYFFVADAPK